jgi:hypothetical protein
LVMGVEVQPNTDMCVQNKVRFEFRWGHNVWAYFANIPNGDHNRKYL